MCSPSSCNAAVIVCQIQASLGAVDKNGVAPQAISLPSGPGSIQGLGESFQPQLNSGSRSYPVPLALALALAHNSEAGSGSLRLG